MKNRTVIIILSLAAILLLFIVLVEKDMTTSTQIGARKNRVFPNFDQDSVDELTLHKTGEEPITLKRSKREDGENQDWQIVSPKTFVADPGEVRMMVSSIDFLLIGRKIDGKALKKDPKYGLVTPFVAVSFGMKGKKTGFQIGAETKDEKVYVSVDGKDDTFYAVEADFLKSFDKTLSDLRSKKLFTESLALAKSIEVQGKDGPIQLNRDERGTWKLDSDSVEILAAEDQVAELIQTLGDMKAQSFAEDDVDENGLEKYSLKKPHIAIKVTLPNGDTTEIRIGNPCKEGETARYVTVVGTGQVVCAEDSFVAVLSRPKDRLEEKRMAVFTADDITQLTITKDDAHISFDKKDGEWKFGENQKGDVEQQVVADLLEALSSVRATDVQAGTTSTAGLGKPDAQIEMHSESRDSQIVLGFFGNSTTGKARLRRGEEQAVLTVPGELLAKIRPDHLFFLKRTIEVGDKGKLERIDIHAPTSQTLEMKDGLWKLTKPLSIEADSMAVRSLTNLLEKIEAVEYASPKPEASQGFDHPLGVITARFSVETNSEDGKDITTSKDVILEIGNKAGTKGRYARIRDGKFPVFILGESYEKALEQPLVARDLLQIEESTLGGLSLEAGDKKLDLKHGEKGWEDSEGRDIDSNILDKILADLGGTKTIRAVEFGEHANHLGSPTLIIKTIPKEDKEATPARALVFGKKSDLKGEDGYFVRSNDLQVTFTYPVRVVDQIISFVENAAKVPSKAKSSF